MAVSDLFKSLFKNKKKKNKNYDPSNPASPTKFLKGKENTKPTLTEPEFFPLKKTDSKLASEIATAKKFKNYALDVGRNASTPIPSDVEIVGRGKSATRRIGTNDPEMGYEGTIKPLGIQKPRSEDQPDRNVVLMGIADRRAARKEANKKRYEEQIAARNKRVTAMRAKGGQFRPTNLKREELNALRQAVRDQAFTEPLGRNTPLGKASANRQQRQLAMKQRNIDSKAKKEAEKKKKTDNQD
tara:strand:- start:27080 stop:27805 length:726 start_codon:yes stop_codon:yes gene_type:complete